MIIAMPATAESILCPHFGHAPMFAFLDIDENEHGPIIKNVELIAPEQGGHDAIPPWLAKRNVSILIAGGIGQAAIENCKKNMIKVVYGAPELPVATIAMQWLEKALSLSPHSCNHSCGNTCGHHHE